MVKISDKNLTKIYVEDVSNYHITIKEPTIVKYEKNRMSLNIW